MKGLWPLILLVSLGPASIGADLRSADDSPVVRDLVDTIRPEACSELLLSSGVRTGLLDPEFVASVQFDQNAEVWMPTGDSLGKVEAHELDTATRYARFIERVHTDQESVALLPYLSGFSVPGFDGIVMDSAGRARANLTFKALHPEATAGVYDPILAIKKLRQQASRKARHYRLFSSWLEDLFIIERDPTGDRTGDGTPAWTRRQNVGFKAKKYGFLSLAWRTFGIRGTDTVRKSRIVIDLSALGRNGELELVEQPATAPFPAKKLMKVGRFDGWIELSGGQKWLDGDPNFEAVVYLSGKQVIEVTATGVGAYTVDQR